MMKRRQAILLLLCILASVVVARAGWWGGDDHDHHHHDHDHDDHHSAGQEMVTCGSMIKLRHVPTGFRLHSHQVAYGSGSGQQSVTGVASGSTPSHNLAFIHAILQFAMF